MKKHAIIPIFVPHAACPQACVFCNQKIITAKDALPSREQVIQTIESFLPTLVNRGLSTIEIGFFGGSFTGLPKNLQENYLSIAQHYKSKGLISGIRLSTRPDYINPSILALLSKYQVDTVELGVQSFDPNVLNLSKRGHDISTIYRACSLIKSCGMNLGIQLMIGLPGDSQKISINSAREAAMLKPDMVRLYPTLVLADTELAYIWRQGQFTPMGTDTLRETTKEMYKILFSSGATILRVGLKSTDLVGEFSDLAGAYHPAFRQIIEGDIMLEQLISHISSFDKLNANKKKHNPNLVFSANPLWFPAMIGHKACNKRYLEYAYPYTKFKFLVEPALPNCTVKASI